MIKNKNFYILIFFFLLGMASTVSQSIIFREFLVIFYGNELVLGFILFTWLFAITVGATIFEPVNKKIQDPERFFLNSVFVFSLLPWALIPIIRMGRHLLKVDYGLFIPFPKMALLSFLVIFPAAFLIGFTFPLGCRILSGKSAVSKIYIIESAGSLAGGVIFSFILVRFMSSPFTAALLSLLFAAALLLYSQMVNGKKKYSILKGGAALVLALSLLLSASFVDNASIQYRWKTLIKDLPLLSSIDSPFQNLALTKQADQYSIYFNGVYGYSFPDEYGDAMTAHHLLTQCPDPKNVLILGEVTPGFINECLKQPVEKLTCVYLDPSLNRIMDPALNDKEKSVLQDPRVNLVFSDGRLYVKDSKEKYDLIFLNLPDPSTAFMNRFYTREFFEELKAVSGDKSVVVLTITSSENYMGKDITDYNGTIYRTLKSVYPYVKMTPDLPTYFFASLSDNAATEDPQVLFERFESRKISNTTFSAYIFESIYDKGRIEMKRERLEKNLEGPLNTDLFPVAYLYNLKLWDHYSNSHLGGIITFMEKKGLKTWIIIIASLTLILAVILFILRRNREVSSEICGVYTVFAAGNSAMGLSVILIFSYQNLYGYLFEKIGFLFALFMMGLALGGWLSHRKIRKNSLNHKFPLVMASALALTAALLPTIVKYLQNQPSQFSFLFYILMVFTGIFSGRIFPYTAALVAKDGWDIDRTSARINAADHLGGCIGALLMGTFFVPLLGVNLSSYLLSFLMISSMILWGIFFLFKPKNMAEKGTI